MKLLDRALITELAGDCDEVMRSLSTPTALRVAAIGFSTACYKMLVTLDQMVFDNSEEKYNDALT